MGTAATPPAHINQTGFSSKCWRVRTTTDAVRMVMTPLTTMTPDWGSKNSKMTGAATNPNPKPTVPITVAATNTANKAMASSSPASKTSPE
jgi:hypothetical protein